MKFSLWCGVLGAATFAWGAAASGGSEGASRIFPALRNGDAAVIREAAARGAEVNARNAAGETPLMYAAMYANAETVKLLLEHGADARAKAPTGTTALMLAVADAEKVRLLLKSGADVNARSVTGRTALLIASSRAGSGEVVKLLLAHGADPNAKDQLQGPPIVPAGAGGSTALIEAAKIRDGKALGYLLDAGAKVDEKDNAGADALAHAALAGNLDNVQRLLAHGARTDARVTVNQFTPLMLAAWRQDARLVKSLLKAGADVNAQDANGATALMWSAYSDYAEPETTQALLDAGARIDARTKAGDTAMTWARKRGETAIVHLLLARGAKDEPAPAPVTRPAAGGNWTAEQSAAKAIDLLAQSGPQFFKVSGCVSCHNQSLPQMAFGAARQAAVHVDEAAAKQIQAEVTGILKPARLPLIEMSDVVPDIAGTAPYLLLGMAADGYAPDEFTDAAILNLAAKQFPDGSWRPWAPRPPLEFSAMTSTALAIPMLRRYAPPALRGEMDQRIAAARNWLLKARPRTNEERAMRLIGLAAADAPRTEIAAATKLLLAGQRAGGGWSQLDTLEPDAYATGQALYALRTAGGIAAGDAAYVRGASYLLKTQEADGSWHVASRSFPFQPYKESGFPHQADQWISAAATGWAALALLPGNEAVTMARR